MILGTEIITTILNGSYDWWGLNYSLNLDTSSCKSVAIWAKFSLAWDISPIDCTWVSTDAAACSVVAAFS